MIFLDNEAEKVIEEITGEAEEKIEEAAQTVEETDEETAEESVEENEQEESGEEVEEEATEETEEESEEIDESDLCLHCGKKHRKENSEYCEKCEKQLIKTKIPFLGFIVGACALVVSLFAFAFTVMLATPALDVSAGDKFASENNWFSAYGEYASASQEITNVISTLGETSPVSQFITTGCNLKLKSFKCIEKVYDPIQAGQYISNIFGSSSTKFTEKNKYIKDVLAISEEYNATSQKASTAIQPIYDADEKGSLTPEVGKKVIADLEKMRDTEGVNNVFLDYFIYSVAGYCGGDDEEMTGYLEKMHKTATESGKDYYWLYYDEYITKLMGEKKYDEAVPLIEHQMEQDSSDFQPANQLLRIYLSKGELDKAEKFVDEFCKINVSSDGSESDSNYVMRIMMHRVKGEYEKAVALANEGNEQFSSPEFSRQLALIDLLNGDYDSAYENAYTAQDMAYYFASYYGDQSAFTTELANTVYLAAYMCDKEGKKNTENAQYIDEFLASYNGEVPDGIVGDIINGKITIEDALTKGVYDLI